MIHRLKMVKPIVKPKAVVLPRSATSSTSLRRTQRLDRCGRVIGFVIPQQKRKITGHPFNIIYIYVYICLYMIIYDYIWLYMIICISIHKNPGSSFIFIVSLSICLGFGNFGDKIVDAVVRMPVLGKKLYSLLGRQVHYDAASEFARQHKHLRLVLGARGKATHIAAKKGAK